VRLNDSAVGTATTDDGGRWSFTPNTPLADGPYTTVVTAMDSAGNTSPPSNTVRFLVDTTPPDTSITSAPTDGTLETSATFDVSSNEAGVTYECSLDGAAFTACSDPATFQELGVGGHTFQVRARDSVGNVDATPASATWIIQAPPIDWALLGNGVGCASSGGQPSSLAMMGLAVLAALGVRRRRR
jgi:MYXO-CTERM domain-containing protein